MKNSASVLKKTGITFTEFLITIITLILLNAVFIAPVVRALSTLVNRTG